MPSTRTSSSPDKFPEFDGLNERYPMLPQRPRTSSQTTRVSSASSGAWPTMHRYRMNRKISGIDAMLNKIKTKNARSSRANSPLLALDMECSPLDQLVEDMCSLSTTLTGSSNASTESVSSIVTNDPELAESLREYHRTDENKAPTSICASYVSWAEPSYESNDIEPDWSHATLKKQQAVDARHIPSSSSSSTLRRSGPRPSDSIGTVPSNFRGRSSSSPVHGHLSDRRPSQRSDHNAFAAMAIRAGRLRIHNDTVPANRQPQNPANVPEHEVTPQARAVSVSRDLARYISNTGVPTIQTSTPASRMQHSSIRQSITRSDIHARAREILREARSQRNLRSAGTENSEQFDPAQLVADPGLWMYRGAAEPDMEELTPPPPGRFARYM